MRVSASGRRGFVYISFVFLGVSTTVFLHSMRKDLQDYNLTITELQFYEIIPFLPWCYKCFFAFFSENVAILGQHQRPYLVGANFMSAILCFFLLFPALDKAQYLVLFFLQQNCAAWADCVLDTMKVGEANEESREDSSASGRFGTRTQIARTLGRWIGRTSGPLLWENMTSKGVYGLLSISYLIPMVLSCFVEEKERPLVVQNRRRLKNSFGDSVVSQERGLMCLTTFRVLFKYLQNRTLVIVLLFVIGTGLFIPTPSTPIFFFFNDIVGLTPAEQSGLNFTSELSQLLALLLFDRWIRKWTISSMYMVFAFLQGASIVFNLLLVTEIPGTKCSRLVEVNNTMILKNDTSCYVYESYNIRPLPLALGETILGDALDELQSLPLTVATSQVCVGQLSGTMFTLIYSLQNLSGILARVFNAQWISVLGIDHYKFENFYILVSAGGVGWLIAFVVAFAIIPRETFSSMILPKPAPAQVDRVACHQPSAVVVPSSSQTASSAAVLL